MISANKDIEKVSTLVTQLSWTKLFLIMNKAGMVIPLNHRKNCDPEGFFCYGDEENARIYAVHLTTANQSKMRRAHLVSVFMS